jgi:hypothetical protein
MHGTMNLKFISAKQAKEVYEYKNIKQKLHKTTAATWFNESVEKKDKVLMILRLLCIWLVFYSLLSSLMHGTMNLKSVINCCI